MTERCDGIFQCSDMSDEDDCHLVTINKEIYNKDYPPRHEGHPVKVNVKVIIVAIQQVQELDMTFSSKLTLVLEWYDQRVHFSNLKSKDLTNLIGYEKAADLWIPPLIFNNTKQNVMVALTPTANLFVNKKGKPEMASAASINEDFNYQGSENVFVYRIDYDNTFNCEFDLSKYPFDTQTCQIEVCFNILNGLKNIIYRCKSSTIYSCICHLLA